MFSKEHAAVKTQTIASDGMRCPEKFVITFFFSYNVLGLRLSQIIKILKNICII